jgi:hypothetical protein
MGLEKDLPPGEQILACLRPFIEHLASSTLSPKTIRRHVDNLWVLAACGRSRFAAKPQRRINNLQAVFRGFWTSTTGC